MPFPKQAKLNEFEPALDTPAKVCFFFAHFDPQ